jgi:hypothetical protein
VQINNQPRIDSQFPWTRKWGHASFDYKGSLRNPPTLP